MARLQQTQGVDGRAPDIRSTSTLCWPSSLCWTASEPRRASGSCLSFGSSHLLPTSPAGPRLSQEDTMATANLMVLGTLCCCSRQPASGSSSSSNSAAQQESAAAATAAAAFPSLNVRRQIFVVRPEVAVAATPTAMTAGSAGSMRPLAASEPASRTAAGSHQDGRPACEDGGRSSCQVSPARPAAVS